MTVKELKAQIAAIDPKLDDVTVSYVDFSWCKEIRVHVDEFDDGHQIVSIGEG